MKILHGIWATIYWTGYFITANLVVMAFSIACGLVLKVLAWLVLQLLLPFAAPF